MSILKESIIYFFLIIISFWLYAPINYAFLNSDQAMHTLMAADFNFSNSTYYWGQNRLGSILPFISSLFVKISIAPMWATSIVQYLFLIGSFLLLIKLLKSSILKIALAVFLFFPLVSYIEYLNIGHPYAPQVFLLLALFYLCKKINTLKTIKNYMYILLFWIIAVLSIWVSELSIIPVFMMVGFTFLSLYYKEHNQHQNIKKIASPFLYSLPLGLAFIYAIYRLLKIKFKDPIFESYGINSLSKTLGAYKIHADRYIDSLLFSDSNFIINFFALIITLFSLYLLIHFILKVKKISLKNLITSDPILFLSISILTFCAINFSEWAGIEFFPHRYYVLSYLFLGIFFILYIDEISFSYKKQTLHSIFLGIVIIGSLSYNEIYTATNRFKKDLTTKNDSKALGETTIIGDYWYSYVIASYNAKNLTALAHEQSFLRNPHQLDKGFDNEEVYLIKDNWFDSFPDTIIQYQRTLIKKHNELEIKIGNAILQKYINTDKITENNEITAKIQKIKQHLFILGDSLIFVKYEDLIKNETLKRVKKKHKIKRMEDKITNNKEWFKSIKERAVINKISIEEMRRLEAEYVISNES